MRRLSASIHGFGIASVLSLAASSSCSESASKINEDAVKSSGAGSAPDGSASHESLARSAVASSEVEPGPLFAAKPPAIVVSAVSSMVLPAEKPGYLATCTPAAAEGIDGAIDNLEDGDLSILPKEKREGNWFSYEETAGTHVLEVAKIEGGPRGSRYALHDSAKVHGGWAGFGVSMGECRYDASKYTGVHFWAKGAAMRLRIIANNPGVIPISGGGSCTKEEEGLCYDAHGSALSVEANWKEYFIPFKDFVQAGWGFSVGAFKPQEVISIEFQLQTENFDLWIDDLGYYREGVAYYPDTPATSGSAQASAAPSSSASASVAPTSTAAPSASSSASAGPLAPTASASVASSAPGVSS